MNEVIAEKPKKVYKKKCVVCGDSFTAHSKIARYCTRSCYRKWYRKNGVIRRVKKADENAEVIRTFICKKCGEIVMVTDTKDKRRTFCSKLCERRYWRHKRKDDMYDNMEIAL